jgi:hypothetical protein
MQGGATALLSRRRLRLTFRRSVWQEDLPGICKGFQ